MDLSPRSLSRAIPWLAAALAAEGIVALTLVWTSTGIGHPRCLQALVHVAQLVFLLAFAGAVLGMTSGGATRIACQRLLYGAYASIALTVLAHFIDVDVFSDAPRGWLFFQALGLILTAAAAPGLWGSAVAREEDLSSLRIRAAARIHAGLTFGAVVLLVASELFLVAGLGIVGVVKAASAIGALSSLALTVGRGFLLVGAWEAWRPAADEIQLRDRARRIRHLMVGAVLGTFWSAAITAFGGRWISHGRGEWTVDVPLLLCYGVAQLTLALLTTILVAIALEAPERLSETRSAAPDFQPPPEPPRDTSPIDVP